MSSSIQAWQKFVGGHRARFVGGDIEQTENPEGTFRGPITSIQIQGGKLIIRVQWSAHLDRNVWRKCTEPDIPHPEVFTYDLAEFDGQPLTTAPQDIEGGRITFGYAFASIVLYPRGGSRLDPSRVVGM